MKVKEITKKLLADACDDLNTVMKFENPIQTDPGNKEVTKATLENDLREAAKELIVSDLVSIPDDPDHLFLQPKTVEVLEALEVVMPVKEKVVKKEVVKEKVVKKETVVDKVENTVEEGAETGQGGSKSENKGQGKGKPEKGKEGVKYTRAQAFCDAIQGKPKTMEEIAQKAMELHIAANPGKKQPQLNSIIWAVKDYLQPLIILGLIEKTDKKYSLK